MVLMRRKDKRRGNKEEEIAVASDSSIVANKGVKSLASARTGRFAADMRVQVGGYGRADKTWGVDHPWHKTREDILEDLSSRDRMEEGYLAKQEKKPEGQGLSRAALKKKKAKMKKGGLTESTAGSEFGSEAASAKVTEEDKPQKEATVPAKAGKGKAKATAAKEEEQAEQNDEKDEETKENTPATSEEAQGSKDKKRKRVNRNKKKKAKNARGDDSSDESELDESVEVVAKSKKQKMAALDAKPTEVVATSTMDKKQMQEDAAKREVIAKQYESALGQEFTTASGLTIRDLKIGNGRVPSIGEQLTVRYRGRIDDKSGIVFGKGMLSTVYGTGSVIAGWEEGMSTMRTGGVRHLIVPPELGYGAVSKGPKLPANSTLFFEVELVRIGKHKRDKIAEDDVPLPSSFQRKRIKSTPAGKDAKGKGDKEKGKRRRRKYSI